MGQDDTGLEIREPTEDELDDIFGVVNQAFAHWPVDRIGIDPWPHFIWKCHSSPDAVGSHIVALQGRRVVGAMLRIDRRVKVRDEVFSAQSGGDSSIIPEFQGQGLHGRMMRYGFNLAKQRNIALHLKVGEHSATVPSWERNGMFYPRNRAAVLFKPFGARDAAGQVERFRGALPQPVAAAGIWCAAFVSRLRHGRSSQPEHSGTAQTCERFDESVDALFESASKDFDFIPVRDRDYLNWRYCDPRGGEYIVRAEWEDGEIVGYCVLTLEGRRAYIVDLLVRSGRLDLVERLAWDTERLAKERNAAGIFCQLPERHPYRNTLLRTGFFDTRRRNFFGVVPQAIAPEKLAFLTRKAARIHMMQGDSDLI